MLAVGGKNFSVFQSPMLKFVPFLRLGQDGYFFTLPVTAAATNRAAFFGIRFEVSGRGWAHRRL